MTKQFLITGGTGFIGSFLVRRLVQSGHKVRVFDNDWRGTIQNIADVLPRVELVQGDIRDPKSVANAIKGVDTVCHLAAINGTENFYKHPDLVLEVSVKGMMNVLDGCKEHQVRDLLVLSTSEVYQIAEKVPTPETVPLLIPDPKNPRYSYAAGKIISEMLGLHANRLYMHRVCIVRPHNVYGPRMGWEHVVPQFIQRISELSTHSNKIQLPIQGTGNETRAFIYIDDMIEGLLKVINVGKPYEIYHLGTQNEVRIQDLATMIGQQMNVDVEVVSGPLQPGSTPRRCPDVSKMVSLGFDAKVSLKEGLKRTVEWYQQLLGERQWSPQASNLS